jgi:transposase-like protein
MFDSTKKAEIVRRHLKDGAPVSDLAKELDVQPSQIHQWIAMALAQLERAFESSGGKKPKRSAKSLENRQARKIDQLEKKLADKNEVIAELMEENIKAKKLDGDL